MSDVITIPITASKIKEQFAYYVDEPKFDLQRYRGMVIAYPDYWRDVNGNIIPDSQGNPQYLRRLPTSGRLRFSDFLGAAGYFVPYPKPTIVQTRLLTTVTGNSNVGTTTHTASFSVDANNHNVVPWRPDITSVVITGQWQLKAPGSSSFVNNGSAESHTVGPKGSATFTRTDDNGDLGVYEWRLQITATSYAANDDAVPSGGALGPDRSVATNSITSNVGKTELEAYVPPDAEIKIGLGSWNEAPDNSPYEGHYAVAIRTIDGFIASKPSPVLSFGGSLFETTFSEAPGREPVTESTAIEWQFKDLQNPLQTDWLPVSELTFEYDGSVYDADLYGASFNQNGIQLSDLDDIRYDGMEFRCKVTATQELSAPTEVRVIEAYTPVYSLDVSIADVVPSYELAGTSAVVNGGTFNFTFTPRNTGTRAYNYSIADPAGDFVSGDTTGSFTVADGISQLFQARTILDTDTLTESFILNVYDTVTTELVATKNLNIIYGEQSWYFRSINQTISETDSVTLHFGADNVGDSSVEIKYERIVTDATGPNDFTLVDGTNWPAGTWLAFDVETDLDQSSDQVIKSVGTLSAIAIKDSAFGGAIDNLEKFRFHLRNPGGYIRDEVDVTVLDDLNYQIDVFGGLNSRSVTYSVVATAASQEVTPVTTQLTWSTSPPWHISMADKIYSTVYYQYQFYHPSFVADGYPGGWRNIGPSINYETFTGGESTWFAFLDGTSQGNSYIVAKPGFVLEFFNIHAETFNNIPLTEYRWRIRARVRATDGAYTAWKYTSAGRLTVNEDYTYIRTGVKYVTCDNMVEGTVDPVTVRVRTTSSVGRSCTVTLSDPEGTGYLIDFPKFGPQRPHPHPVNPVSGTITSNTTVFKLGAWLYHSYGYTENLPTFTRDYTRKYMRATAQLGGGSSIPIDNYSGVGKVPVADDTPYISVSTPQTIDSNKISLKPGDKFDLSFWGRNMRGQSSLMGHGDYHFGFGYYIIGNNGGTYAERIQDAQNWFYPQSTSQIAEGTSSLGPSDEIVMAHNYYTPTFTKAQEITSSDYFTMAYGKKMGTYVATPRPAGRLIEVDPSKRDLYFEPRKYTIVPTSFQPNGGYQSSFDIVLWPLADPPAEYEVDINTVESAPIRALASRGYRLTIVNDTGEPQDLNHRYTVTYDGEEPMFSSPLTDTIRLTYPSGQADVFVLVPTAEAVGREFTITITNSVGEVKGQKTFQVADQGDYQLVIYPEGSIVQDKTQVFRVAPADSDFYRENLLDMTHTYEFTFDGTSPFNASPTGEFEIYTTSFGGFSIPIKNNTGNQTFTLTIKDILGIVRAQETYTIGYAELEVSVQDIVDNTDVYDSNNYWRINHDFFGTYAEIEVKWQGQEVYRQRYTGTQKDLAQRVISGGGVYRGGGQTGYSYQQNWAVYDGSKPEGFSNATASGGSGTYVDYHWTTSTSEGGLYTTAVMNLLDPFDNDLTNGTKLYAQGRDEKVTGAVTCRVTDSAGNQGTGSGLIRFNQTRRPGDTYEPPPAPELTVTISGPMDDRTTIPQNGGDDGYVEDTVSGSVSGGSGSYSTRWSFTNATAIRVTGLNGSGQINKPTYRLGVSGANGLEALPVGTAGTWRGTLTYTATDNNTGATGSASVGIFFMIEVVQGGINPPSIPPGPPGIDPSFDPA